MGSDEDEDLAAVAECAEYSDAHAGSQAIEVPGVTRAKNAIVTFNRCYGIGGFLVLQTNGQQAHLRYRNTTINVDRVSKIKLGTRVDATFSAEATRERSEKTAKHELLTIAELPSPEVVEAKVLPSPDVPAKILNGETRFTAVAALQGCLQEALTFGGLTGDFRIARHIEAALQAAEESPSGASPGHPQKVVES